MIVGITCYFNPNQCPYRLANFQRFSEEIRRCGLPLYVVELANGDQPFQIEDSPNYVIKRVRSKDLMFQKERLLNIALDMLPADCDEVIWIDCDIVFTERNWVKSTSKALKSHPVVQPFSHCLSLPKCDLGQHDFAGVSFNNCSGSGKIRRGYAHYHSLRLGYSNLHNGHVGYVWAARREFLDKHRFYDHIVTGAGDLFMVMAYYGTLGWIDYQDDLMHLSDEACFHFFDWAVPVYEDVKGNVGWTNNIALHLWHGELHTRNYLNKSRQLQLNKFDPRADLKLNEDGCWEWSGGKPDLSKGIADIFNSQRTC